MAARAHARPARSGRAVTGRDPRGRRGPRRRARDLRAAAAHARGRGGIAGRHPAATPSAVRSRAFELGSHRGHEVLGRLFLDAPDGAVESVVRTIEIAVDAAWSRAEVHVRAERLSALETATRAVAAELDIDRVLGVIVDRVRDLVGARYAALGIADGRGRIERFITSGLSPEARSAIGAVPRGHGLLGMIIREGRTIRVPDIARDPAAYGFPPAHPLMTSFLGAPDLREGPLRRQPLPDGPGGRASVHRGRRAPCRDVRRPCRDRDRECAPPRPGPAAGGRGGARADRQGPPRRDHPEHLRGRPVARGRPGAGGGRVGPPTRRSRASTARSTRSTW